MAEILGDCITRQRAIFKAIDPEIEVMIWSDMLDPSHNARDNYYGVVVAECALAAEVGATVVSEGGGAVDAAAIGSDRAQSDAGVGPNLAATGSLPRGRGLAWDFPGDHNLVSHPAVIFADNFETPDFRQRWDSVRDDAGEVLSLVDPEDGTGRFGSRSLQVTVETYVTDRWTRNPTNVVTFDNVVIARA
jgi:hypothetical protein